MFVGNSAMAGLWAGESKIFSVWLGDSLVWTNPYTYQVSNVTIKYSSGSMILTDNSNYAYVSCTLKTYNNGTLVKTENNYPMSFRWSDTSQITSTYCSTTPDNKIYFNIDKHGTDNMSNFGESLTLSLDAFVNGYNHTSKLYITVQPNLITYSSLEGYSITVFGNYDVLPSNVYYFTLFTDFFEETYNEYNSGKRATTKERMNVYYYDGDNNYLGTCTSFVRMNVGYNENAYPVLHEYRLSYSNTDVTPDDVYYRIMHRSNVSRGDSILALFDTDGNELAYGDTVKSNDLDDIILLNDAHKHGTYYEFDTDNSEISIREENGLIIISNVTSSLNNYLYITASYTDEEGREYEDYAYIILNYWM